MIEISKTAKDTIAKTMIVSCENEENTSSHMQLPFTRTAYSCYVIYVNILYDVVLQYILLCKMSIKKSEIKHNTIWGKDVVSDGNHNKYSNHSKYNNHSKYSNHSKYNNTPEAHP